MKKILALLISVALLFSMVVVPVSAEDDVTYISEKKNVLFADVNEKLEFSDIFVKVKKYVINALQENAMNMTGHLPLNMALNRALNVGITKLTN